MQAFVIEKISRYSENPCPYNGPSLRLAGMNAAVYLDRMEASAAAHILSQYNPVGFHVVEVDMKLTRIDK